MADESLQPSDLTSPPQNPADPGAATTPPPNADVSAAVAEASRAAVRKHVATGRKPPGRPRTKNAGVVTPGVEGLGAFPDQTILADGAPNRLQMDFQNEPPVDEETITVIVEGLVSAVEDVGCGWLSSQVLAATGNEQLAVKASAAGVMSERTKNLLDKGGKLLARKWMKSTEWAPEGMVAVGLGMYAFGLKSRRTAFLAELHHIAGTPPQSS